MIKSFAKALAARFHLHIYRSPPEKNNGSDLAYGMFVAHGYAPWLTELDFCAAYESMRNVTLVDVYRAYELWNLIKQVAKLPDEDLLEVGTWRGGTGCLIALRAGDVCPGAKVFLADTFEGIVKAG